MQKVIYKTQLNYEAELKRQMKNLSYSYYPIGNSHNIIM